LWRVLCCCFLSKIRRPQTTTSNLLLLLLLLGRCAPKDFFRNFFQHRYVSLAICLCISSFCFLVICWPSGLIIDLLLVSTFPFPLLRLSSCFYLGVCLSIDFSVWNKKKKKEEVRSSNLVCWFFTLLSHHLVTDGSD